MPFSTIHEAHPIVERVLRMRKDPVTAYGFAVALVLLAILVRLAAGTYVGSQIPFITFFPAIIVATLLGRDDSCWWRQWRRLQ